MNDGEREPPREGMGAGGADDPESDIPALDPLSELGSLPVLDPESYSHDTATVTHRGDELPDDEDEPTIPGPISPDALAAASAPPRPPVELPSDRYRVADEIGRGGMGAIYRVEDVQLHRDLAMKVLLKRRRDQLPTKDADGEPDDMHRFLEEAQVTAQLDHPGVVSVHELGIDSSGAPFFTMSLVRGETLSKGFRWAREGSNGWDLSRALNALQRVCETVAFAHDRGVIHRDLKPANVMVGQFGEVYVMDWGLAKVLKPGARAAAPAPGAAPAVAEVRTVRSEVVADGTASLETVAGRALGTPAYMPPEQAEGRQDEVDDLSDVYAIGAMLYRLLAGHPPYMKPGEKQNAWKIMVDVARGPPRPLAEIAPDTPAELISIAEKAMARAREDRYASAAAMGEDLRRFLSGHVVQAYRTGPWVEAVKWVQRNRALAGTAVGALVVIVILTVGFLTRIQDERDEAHFQRDRARKALDDVFRLADVKELRDLTDEAEQLWPIHPRTAPGIETWIDRAERLIANLPGHRTTLEELEKQALPYTDAERQADHAEDLADLEQARGPAGKTLARELPQQYEALVRELEGRIAVRKSWSFPAQELAWQHEVLANLVAGIEALQEPEGGLLATVRTRLAKCTALADDTQHAGAWELTVAAIADAQANPLYEGLVIERQIGLVPLGKDPRSGLFEFAHVNSGTLPTRAAGTGELALEDKSAIVLVLIPRTVVWIGAQSGAEGGSNYDPQARDNEGPVHEVTLAPHFIAKFECTQAQWWEMTGGDRPSNYKAGATIGKTKVTWRNPVESVTWEECDRWLRRYDLTLPTEAQWENACRAGTQSGWSGVDAQERLEANVADKFLSDNGGPREWSYTVELDDGHAVHAPCGSYPPNANGLHDVHGNVWEWCLDWFGPYDAQPKIDPVENTVARTRVKRGGAWADTAYLARAANRYHLEPNARVNSVGVRAAKRLTGKE